MQVGSPVLLSLQGGARTPAGAASSASAASRCCASPSTTRLDADDDAVFRVDLADDEAARLRQRQALDRAGAAKGDRLAELRGVLLGEAPPAFAPPSDFTPLDDGLNASQREAVRFALSARDVAVDPRPAGHRQDDDRSSS